MYAPISEVHSTPPIMKSPLTKIGYNEETSVTNISHSPIRTSQHIVFIIGGLSVYTKTE